MNILVLNCGSSSVKFQLIATDLELIAQNQDRRLARGVIERIGGEAIVTLRAEGRAPQRSTAPYNMAMRASAWLENESAREPSAVLARLLLPR